jgi:O-antigen ligase
MATRLEAPSWDLPAAFGALAGLMGLLAGVEPRLAIGAAFGLAFLLAAFTNLAAGLVAFTFLSFLEFALPAGAALSFTKGAGLCLALAWVARAATTKADERTFFAAHPGATGLLLAFLAWGTLSLAWSESHSGTFVDLSRYLLNFTLLVIAFTALDRRRYVMWVVSAWIFGTALTAAYGLVSQPSAGPSDAYRLASTVGNANVLATVLVAGLVLSVAAALIAKRSPLLRMAAWTAALLALFGFIFTGSRSGVIALAVVIVTTVAVAGPRWRPRAVGAAVAMTLVAVTFFFTLAPAAIRDRIAETAPGQVPSTEGRGTIWQIGWRMVEAEPLHGVGLGSFQTSSAHYLLQPGALYRSDQVLDKPQVAHNIYLQNLAELGIVGEVLFLAVLAFPIACAVRAAKNFAEIDDRSMEILSRALVVALAGILAADFFASEQFNKLLWLLLAMGPVLLSISMRGDPDGDADLERPAG